ncbi:MAG TPA: hypothetical protein VMY42_26470, partial [Thermoguttaceae bacterium]|nr:hypothetical protein [Thermoguttaceae bacterium]
MKSVAFVSALIIGILATANRHAVEGADRPGPAADAPFASEQWPEARTLVWAEPGTSDMAPVAGNWIEYASAADYLAGKEGRPAAQPSDANTDLILPDAPGGRTYIVGFFDSSRRWHPESDPPKLSCRHVTVGKGAGLDG